jgi:glycosyltransferase involved in cell wall biosynthesis
VFVGRLSAEKGVETLLEAWRHLDARLPLKIVGDGPLSGLVHAAARKNRTIEWLGNVPLAAVYELIGQATVLVLPSQCYESFPRVVVEAFAKGTPVLVSRLGAMAEIVHDGCTGLHFNPGDPLDLVEKLRSIVADPLKLRRMREAAREEFEQQFTADVNHRNLVTIYERVLGGRSQR